ncbi:glutamate receptor ionotropic, NMDA 3A [Elysia marginata]|uniref:Glutamate receptor ionotropic, NMDA 3A n=1 Tax=Elysia marginata TaxID=1093978 RepID=A0AAV4HEN4_9GAST|nr:glutamate receptor ionotropic, NMDA 3A [Elysia marginata]
MPNFKSSTYYRKTKLDALLGDYPILDYARAHLAPRCELKLISKIFGDDIYGIGLPKKSPLKAALSKKISEYHRMGYIDDLIDVHFADAHCYKRRISEEDSQLAVTHHAGLFVMMCVGVGVGVLVLLLEHVTYKFLVPYIRNCPMDSRWRSTHLMFFSQRLQRTIQCAELISPQQSAKEIMGIFKKREFVRLFQKSTIRRNRLADIAKTKRINRNFHDIVEKAKWLQEMKESGLMDDDTPSTPTIIEIPLRQLTVNVELGNSSLKLNCQEDGESTHSTPIRRPSQLAAALREEMARAKLELQGGLTQNGDEASDGAMLPFGAEAALSGKGREVREAGLNEGSSDESTSAGSGDSLLGGSAVPSERSLPTVVTYKPDSPVLYVNDDDDSASSSSSTPHHQRLRRPSRDRHRRRQQPQQHHHHYKPQQHRKAAVTSSSPELVLAPDISFSEADENVFSESLSKRLRSLSVDHTLPPSPALLDTPTNKTRRAKNSTPIKASPQLPSALLINELPTAKRLKHQPYSIAMPPVSHGKSNNSKKRHSSTGSYPRSWRGLPYSEPLPNGRDFLTSAQHSHPPQGDENDGDVEDVDEFHDDDEDDDDGIENITVRLNVNLPSMHDSMTPTVLRDSGDRSRIDSYPHHSNVPHPYLSGPSDLLEEENASYAGAGASASSNMFSSRQTSKAFQEIPSDDHYRQRHRPSDDSRMVRSLLHSSNSYRDRTSHEAAAEPSVSDLAFSLDSVSKEELLVLWKSSEMDLNRRLQEALAEKSRLERRLAMLQNHSPV